MSKLRRFDLLRIAHLEVSEDLPQQEGILRNLPNNLEAGIPTIPNKDPWSCEEYTLNLNHSTWGYLKYNSFTRKKSQKKDGQMCLLVTKQPFLRHFLVGQFQCPKQKTPPPPFLKLLKVWDKRSDFSMAHNDASTLQFIETGQVLGKQREGFPLWWTKYHGNLRYPPHLPQETSP